MREQGKEQMKVTEMLYMRDEWDGHKMRDACACQGMV